MSENKIRVGCLGDDERFHDLMIRLKITGLGNSVSASEWQEVEDFLWENLITEERIQKEYEAGQQRGLQLGRAECRERLMNKACTLFMSGQDSEAKKWRTAAEEIPRE